jgi:hypothetical protein
MDPDAEIYGVWDNYHTDFSLYSDGANNYSGGAFRDPYIPIENEQMGRDWDAKENDSSDPTTQKIYPYHNIYSMNDPLRKNDYYLDNSPAVREYLFSNMPSFHQTEPYVNIPAPWRFGPRQSADDLSPGFMLFVVLIFMFLIIVSMFQNAKIDKIYQFIHSSRDASRER